MTSSAPSLSLPEPTPLARLLALVRAERAPILTLLSFSVAVGFLTLATPVAAQALVDAVAFGGLLQPLLIVALVLFGCLGLGAMFRALQLWVAELLERRLFVRVVALLGRRLPRARLDALDLDHPPELVNRFFDVVTVQKVGSQLLLDGFTVLLTALAGLLLLAFYHPVLLALDLALVAAILLVVLGLGRGAIDSSLAESRAKYRAAAWLEELARHPRAFRGHGGPVLAAQRADDLARVYVGARQRHFRVLFRQLLGVLALQVGATSVLMGVGGWLVIAGSLTLGQLVASELVVTVVVSAVAKLGKSLGDLYDLLAALEKLGHLLDLPTERVAGETVSRAGPAALRVRELRHGRLERIELGLAAGEPAAVLGPAGSGKSLLLDLLYGVRAPDGGSIEVDGVDLRELHPDHLRARVALVRGPEVIEGTLLENVRFGREVELEQVRAALAAVNLDEVVRRLPDGLETALSSGGAPLSETEARLLVLARALVGRPGLLLLDGTLDGLAGPAAWPLLVGLGQAAADTTLLVATSRPEVAELFPRHFELVDGRTSPATGRAA